MRTYSKKTKVVVAAVSAGTLAMSGVAYAYWSTTGSGSGTATTVAGEVAGTPSISVVSMTAPTAMAPGITSGAVNATLHNTSTASSAYVNTVTVTIGQPTKGENPTTHVPVAAPNCSASDYEIQPGTASNIYHVSAADPTGNTSVTMDVKKEIAPENNSAANTSDDVALPDAQLGFYDKSSNQDGCKGVTVPLIVTTN